MATTSEAIVLKLVAGMFGGTPGSHLNSLVVKLNSGGTLRLAIELGNSPFFTELYPTTQGGHAFADAFLAHLVPDYQIGNPAHLWAMNWLAAEFDRGVPVGQVVLNALNVLEATPLDDPTWGATRAQWNEWIAIAHRLLDAGGTVGSTLEQLQDALHPPVFSSAEVTGTALVLHYSDLNGLSEAHPPVLSAFSVKVNDVTRSYLSAVVDTDAGTVTLNLVAPTFHGEVVTVAYTDPTTGDDTWAIQDALGNDAASVPATVVTNNNASVPDTTGPVLVGATVDGDTMRLTYNEASPLDAANPPATTDFTVKVDGVAVALALVIVNAASKTVTLLLDTAVTDTQVVTVAYKDPTAADDAVALQDAVGNDAATLTATAVANQTADTTAPEFEDAEVNGDTLVMTYTDSSALDSTTARPSAFVVNVAGGAVVVEAVAVDAVAKTVTLTLATAATAGQAVTVSYTDATVDDDARAIQDVGGHDAATLPATTVTNNTPDATRPVFASATVNGSTLVMTYTESTTLDAGSTHIPLPGAFAVKVGGVTDAVTAVAVNAGAKTVTLTLTTAALDGQAVTVAYTDGSSGNDTRAIQDAAGNDAATLAATAVTNNTPDTTAPVFAGATVTGTTLVMSYTDLHDLNAAQPPVIGDFAVTVDTVANLVTGVAVDADAKTVTLTLTNTVTTGAVALSYTDPSGSNDTTAIQDLAGNDVVSLVGVSVTIV
ncbi:MAG: SwmB domain-containing protein [Phycisphaerae bacterium]